jgi:hypothetical protein
VKKPNINHPVKMPQAAIKILVIIAIHTVLIGCVSTTNQSIYEAKPPSSMTQSDVTYYLKLEPKRHNFELDLIFMAGSAGPPYTLSLSATTNAREKRMKTLHIKKIRMVLPDGTEYDVLQGKSVSVAPEAHGLHWVNYRSAELPLEFQEGGVVVIEVHCVSGSSNVVIRKVFVGKRRANTESIWEAYARC